ncbi:MAG: hypothetical protein HYY20_00895 [Candidatus Tectomicrobia bacterium]|uniref:Porin n=1 Tax=Tectimicrobiota bacterium TaxID=2528274 RepID=A0A932CL62_UNCTE|nr:hypothetical protein [Candidatus Tectomicrobia bacterium]
MKRVWGWLVLGFMLIWPSLSWAATDAEELIQLLKAKGVLTQEEVNTLQTRVKEREKKEKTLQAFYKDGFQVQTADKSFEMKVGGRVQADYLVLDSNNNANDGSFSLRGIRIESEGKLFKHTKFKAQLDMGEGKDANLKDGYLNFDYLKWAQLKIGQYKEPFSLEELTSSRHIDFLERSAVVTNLAPSRDLGVMLHSELWEGTLGYGLGIFNGSGSNQKRDQNDDKDLAGRFYVRPFAQNKSRWLKGLQFAGNFTWGNQEGGLKNLQSPVSETPLARWANGVTSDDRRTRLGADLAWVIGPFSLKTEYIRTDWKDLQRAGQREDLDAHGWYVTLSYFLTGEEKPYKEGAFTRLKQVQGVFNPFNHEGKGWHWGAWELLARYDTLRVDDKAFDLGFATGTDRVNTLTMGLNWYPHNMVVVKFNYVHNDFADDLGALKGDDQEDLFLTRFQVEF